MPEHTRLVHGLVCQLFDESEVTCNNFAQTTGGAQRSSFAQLDAEHQPAVDGPLPM